jgi:DNA sulfur modification protein DndD
MSNRSNLLIHLLTISNYRQYYGKSIVEFSRDPKKNFTIIQGSMGSGKTNLLNAISWCLYGEEKKPKFDGLPIINTRLLNETQVGDFLEMEISVMLGYSDRPKYNITRKISCFKRSNDRDPIPKEKVLIPRGLDVTVNTSFMEFSEQELWTPRSHFESAVNSLLPKDFADFFLFDGEELVRFFDEGLKNIKDGIEDVSQISLTNSAIKHLEQMESFYRNKTKGYDQTADDILMEINAKNNWYSKLTNDKDQKRAQSQTVDQRLGEIVRELRNNDRKIVALKQEKKDLLIDARKRIDIEIQNLERQRKELVVSWGPKVYLIFTLFQTKEIIETAVKERQLPPLIDYHYWQLLLNTGECICGSNISKGESRARIQALLDRAKLSPIYTEINLGKSVINRILDSFPEVRTQLSNISNKVNEQEEERKKNKAEIDNINIELKNINEKRINYLVDEEKRLLEDQKRFTAEIAVLEKDISRLKTHLVKMTEDHQKIIQRNTKIENDMKRMDLCKECEGLFRNIQEDLILKVRKTVEKKTKDYFLNMIWKKNTFNDVSIEDNYDIRVAHVDGYNATGSLSAGETLFLALSFIAALREISGFDFPIVIDTPLGRVSGKPRILAAENLPRYLPSTQITMLVTDTEYNSPIIDDETNENMGSFRNKVIDYVGKEYRIVYDESNRDANVIEYGSS